jgi:LysR family hydrogen peroxide-inducible transcriptional activator
MTLVQLEYIIAVDQYRHFAAAAASCFVTQPTLSMQVQKLEEELGLKLFDRSKQPVVPTEYGFEIIEQSRKIIMEREALLEIIEAKKGVIRGEFRIGIIPTLAPYLLPLFIQSFTSKYPLIRLQITELTTSSLIAKLKDGKIDAGILVTPLHENGIKETPLFYEEMLAYVSKTNAAFKKTYMLPVDIDPEKLWLLEEGHCFRSQIMNLCELRKKSEHGIQFEYEAGSLETLRRMVDLYDGVTILPELATIDMTTEQKVHLRNFRQPVPVREVSLVVHRTFVKKRLVEAMKQEIMDHIPEKIRKNKKTLVVPVLEKD